jgi:prepilin-type N-terminal cleavage/methylation domain-containing protein
MKIPKSTQAFTLIELLVVISIIAILAGIALPVFSQVQEKGKQTQDLSNAKQVGLACKIFATDNDGRYPYQNGQVDPPASPANAAAGLAYTSNQVFASLIPNYLPTEKIFYLAGSAWSPNRPDEKIIQAADRCEANSNNYAYMYGMYDTYNPSYPLVFDAPMSSSTTYSTNPATKGGVWKGKKAIVIRCDGSGSVETCTLPAGGSTSTIQGQTGGTAKTDILVPNAGNNWMDSTANGVLYPQ